MGGNKFSSLNGGKSANKTTLNRITVQYDFDVFIPDVHKPWPVSQTFLKCHWQLEMKLK